MNAGVNSLDDRRIADYRLLADPSALKHAGLFVAEGRLVVRRLLGLPRFAVRSVLVTPPARAALDDVLRPGITTYVVEQRVMNAITGFNMHRGCLALAERPQEASLSSGMLESANRVLVLEGVNNPDNIGGLFRSAAAFGVDLVVLGPDCGDPLYRKAIRTSMAAALQVPFVDRRRMARRADAPAVAGAACRRADSGGRCAASRRSSARSATNRCRGRRRGQRPVTSRPGRRRRARAHPHD